jgi:hypothetical protein
MRDTNHWDGKMSNATPEDFSESLRFQLDKTSKETLIAINRMQGEWTLRGSAFSSRYYLERFEIAEAGFHRGVDVALGQCRRAMRITGIEPSTLRRITEERLDSFRHALESRIVPTDGAFKRIVTERLPKLQEHLQFALRQFDVGLHVPPEPDTPMATNQNIMHVNMSGGMVQQGTSHSTQSATNAFNSDGAKDALAKFAEALKAVSLPADVLKNVEADIATIRAQLAKSEPSTSILREVGQSLRNVIEGIAGGIMTDPAGKALLELCRMLGLT